MQWHEYLRKDVQPLNKLVNEVPTENVRPAKNSKGGKIGEDKHWNKDYGATKLHVDLIELRCPRRNEYSIFPAVKFCPDQNIVQSRLPIIVDLNERGKSCLVLLLPNF